MLNSRSLWERRCYCSGSVMHHACCSSPRSCSPSTRCRLDPLHVDVAQTVINSRNHLPDLLGWERTSKLTSISSVTFGLGGLHASVSIKTQRSTRRQEGVLTIPRCPRPPDLPNPPPQVLPLPNRPQPIHLRMMQPKHRIRRAIKDIQLRRSNLEVSLRMPPRGIQL